jgi:hypothetical protein
MLIFHSYVTVYQRVTVSIEDTEAYGKPLGLRALGQARWPKIRVYNACCMDVPSGFSTTSWEITFATMATTAIYPLIDWNCTPN